MVNLSKRLDEKSTELLERFERDHPIMKAIGQPLNAETKRIMHRLFRVNEDFGPEWSRFAVIALDFVDTDKEKEILRSFVDNFSKESIEIRSAQEFIPFFGEISAEVRAEKSCEALKQMKALMDRVLAKKDGLHCLVMFYAATRVMTIFWKSANKAFAQALPCFQMYRTDDGLNAFREAIDSHPKAQTIDDRTFEDYANTYMEFLDAEYKGYNYFYNLSQT